MSQQLFKGRRVLWMPFEVEWSPPAEDAVFCCEAMTAALQFACDQHADPFECGDGLMIYNDIFGEFGLPVHDGGASYVLISHCPWCGSALGDSARDRWFDETDAILADGRSLPPDYLSGAWRKRT